MSGWSLFFQVINFVVLALLLRRFLFKPVTAVIARRQEELAHTKAESERALREAEAVRAAAEQDRATVDANRRDAAVALKANAEKERDEILVATRTQAADMVGAARREIEAERQRTADAASAEAVRLAATIAKRLLDEVATSAVSEAMLERLVTHFDALSPERKRALRLELDGAELLIATAPALDDEVRARWVEEIGERVGERSIRFVRDDTLVAGAEMRFPHTVVSFTWRDGLAAIEKELLQHEGR